MRDLVLLGIIAGCSLIALRRPVIGMFTFAWLGFFNPQNFTWGTTIPYSQIVAAATIVGYIFSSEKKQFPRQREFSLLVLLWGLFGFTTLFAIYPDRAFPVLQFVSKILLMVFLCMILVDTKEKLFTLLRVISLSIGFYAVKGGIFALSTGGEQLVWGPENSFLYANNMIGMAMAMNVPLLLFLRRNENRWWLRSIMWAMLVFSYPATIFTFSRGAWLGLGMVTVLSVLRSRYKFQVAAAAIIFAISLLPVVLDFAPDRLINRFDDLENYDTESSAQMRLGSWAYCWRVGFGNPLTGGGFDHYSSGTYKTYAPEYHARWGEQYNSACHSSWFSILGEHGVLGFVIWLGLLGSVVMSSWRIRSVTGKFPDKFWMFDLAGALQIALAGYVVPATFIDAAYFDMVYYLVAVVVILKELVERANVDSKIAAHVNGENHTRARLQSALSR